MTRFSRFTKSRSHSTLKIQEAAVAKASPGPLTFEDGHDDEQLVGLGDHGHGLRPAGGVCWGEEGPG